MFQADLHLVPFYDQTTQVDTVSIILPMTSTYNGKDLILEVFYLKVYLRSTNLLAQPMVKNSLKFKKRKPFKMASLPSGKKVERIHTGNRCFPIKPHEA